MLGQHIAAVCLEYIDGSRAVSVKSTLDYSPINKLLDTHLVPLLKLKYVCNISAYKTST